MDKKFIYVFTLQARDLLLNAKYNLLSSDDTNNIFIFAADSGEDIDWNKIIFLRSDTLLYNS